MSDGEADERADWSAALAHDAAAFARLFDRHRDPVYRQALRLLPQPADAEEVASASFFELWRRRDAVRLVDGSIRPWLLATAANLARNSRRTRLRREAFLRRLTFDHLDHDDRAFERIDDDLVRSDLAALARLSPDDVAPVTLTALEDYRVAEVAALLGLSDGAARVRLHRAHRRLRGLLSPAADTQEVAR